MSSSLVFEQLITKNLEKKDWTYKQIEGTSSLVPLTLLLKSNPQFIPGYKHLLLVEEDHEARTLVQYLESQNLNCLYLPDFDVSPYSGLSPRSDLSSQRLRFLHHISTASSDYSIYVTTMTALSLKTLPKDHLDQNTYNFKVGEELPDPIQEFLTLLGYRSVSIVEQPGQYSMKGGILDIFSPAHTLPIRIELFGDEIHTFRYFNVETQRSETKELSCFTLIPAKETFYTTENPSSLFKYLNAVTSDRKVAKEDLEQTQFAIRNQRDFVGQEFFLKGFWDKFSLAKDFFPQHLICWLPNKEILLNKWQVALESLQQEYQNDLESLIHPKVEDLYSIKSADILPEKHTFLLDEILLKDLEEIEATDEDHLIKYSCTTLKESLAKIRALKGNFKDLQIFLASQFQNWKQQGFNLIISAPQDFAFQRAEQLCAGIEQEYTKGLNIHEAIQTSLHNDAPSIFITKEPCLDTLKLNEENLILLRFKDLFGKTISRSSQNSSADYFKKLDAIRFGEIKSGDFLVHIQHGLGCFEGLKIMDIQGVTSEFLEIRYKDKDKLYLPVHRINQIKLYNGPHNETLLDKLGGSTWEKAKIKVKNHIRDVANDLLQMYAERSLKKRSPYKITDSDLFAFENEFPFDETEDQIKAIHDIRSDLLTDKPMDRLVCGDVGFGKTEVAMRAAFQVLLSGKQVAVLAPTTVLTFQHFRSFKKRLAHWGFNIKSLNRFVSPKEVKETLRLLKTGEVDLVVGTHRLLSQDVEFKNLGLLICDEEQKFGVKHKEKIRKLKTEVDTLILSATPIPRTLNMGLMGLRDLSLITTAPIDRQPTRTFVTKYNPEIIKKAIYSEIQRGGQVYYVHNRVQSIYGIYDELRNLMPDVRIAVGHGQMAEHELEKVMLAFFNHEIDVLLSTTIIESGVDIPNANTMFIDQAQQFGLSQLYQLRGRVGRSKNKAYCYLIIPKGRQIEKDALERLKILQENTALGSGIRIAHYDLELRGAGNLLGEDQSGHVNVVGYDLYMELLQQAVAEVQGKKLNTHLDPEINISLPALIPSDYIPDIRMRLSFYKALSTIESPEEIDQIEEEMRDQYGTLPDAVLNLFMMMLVKKICKDKGIKEVGSGPKNLSLKFDTSTTMSIDRILALTRQENKKYKLLPDDRLLIRMNEITWPRIYDEINFL
ncbi:MAG: transcription-repair coupling factor [Bdellovibrionaceae bacterium]|nr:transcription-repair coupling factor [Pseudobdellovibrionaceae bacterium]